MKTLIFCAGAANPDLSVLQHITPDVLVGVDAGAATLVAHGYTPDWAIGDFDSQPVPDVCQQVLRLPAHKNDTDLEAALEYVLGQYQDAQISQIIILGAMGAGRIDHLLANIWLAHQARFAAYLPKMRWLEQGNSVRFYGAGEHVLLHEADKKYVSFITLTPVRQLYLRGVKYPLEGVNFAQPRALVSNECAGSIMKFSLESGLLCVIQSSDLVMTKG